MTKYFRNNLQITLPGKVQPQERPRFSTWGGHVKAYDPPKSKKYKEYVSKTATSYSLGYLIESPIRLNIDVYIEIPKSYTKKVKKEIEDGTLLHIKRPDVDNLAKGIKDGLTGVIWKDDSLIVDMSIRKHYSDNPRAEIFIEW